MHLHLQPLGGLAGDMLVAGLLDAAPELVAPTRAWVAGLPLPVPVELDVEPHQDQGISGVRAVPRRADPGATPGHTSYAEIRALLTALDLSEREREVAERAFALLAEAEARVHACPPDEVHFHEAGAWDSLADVLLTAHLVDQLDIAQASSDALPLGSGTIRTQHGRLPVPAPATAHLLTGLPVRADGPEGETVTPTGAALFQALTGSPTPEAGQALRAVGRGLGSRPGTPGHPNVLQVLLLDTGATPSGWLTDRVVQLTCDIDDQTPEDLSAGLDHIRQVTGVLSVVLSVGQAKKGRPYFRVEVLARAEAAEHAVAAMFAETTTLGIRQEELVRHILRREGAGPGGLVKVAHRVGGSTAKAESDAVAGIPGHRARAAARRSLEESADGR